MEESQNHICTGSNAQDKYWKQVFHPLFKSEGDSSIISESKKLISEFYPEVKRGPVGETLLHRLILGHPDKGKENKLRKVLDLLLKLDDPVLLKEIVCHAYNRRDPKVAQVKSGTERSTKSLRYKELVFDGETGLHLAIAFGDMELVEKLLSLGADLCSRAYGSTFAPGVSRTYFGEYPLSLAAAMGSMEVAEIMLRHYSKQTPAVLDNEQDIVSMNDEAKALEKTKDALYRKMDTFDNNAFHIAIINHRIDFYIFLLKEAVRDGLTAVQVSEFYGAYGLTPLTLAVLWYPDGSGFQKVLDTFKGKVLWVFSGIEARLYPLQQIDSVPSEGSEFISVIYLVTRYNILGLAENHLLQSILKEKWNDHLAIPAYVAMIIHVWFLGVITAYTVMLHPHGRLDDERAKSLQQMSLGVSIFYFVGIFYDIVVCLNYRSDLQSVKNVPGDDTMRRELDLPQDILSAYKSLKHKAAYPNYPIEMPTMMCYFGVPLTCWDVIGCLGTIFMFLHVATRSETEFTAGVPTSLVLLGIADLCIWVSTLAYMTMYERTGLLVSMISRTLVRDFMPFVCVFTAIICGVSVAVFSIQRSGMTLPQVIDLLKRLSIGVYQHETFEPQGHGETLRVVSYVFLLIFTLLSLLLLLNLLIATLSTTYQQYINTVHQTWSLDRASRILLWECRLRFFRRIVLQSNKGDYLHLGETSESGPEGSFGRVESRKKKRFSTW